MGLECKNPTNCGGLGTSVRVEPAGGCQYGIGIIQQRINALLDQIVQEMVPLKPFFESPDRAAAYNKLLESKQFFMEVGEWKRSICNITNNSNGCIVLEDLEKIPKALNQFKGHFLFGALDEEGKLMTGNLIKYFNELIKSESNQPVNEAIVDLKKVVIFLDFIKYKIQKEQESLMTQLQELGKRYLIYFDYKTEKIESGFKIQGVVGASMICKGQDGFGVCGKVAVLVDVVTADNIWHFDKDDRAKFHFECAVYAKARPNIMANELNKFFEITPGATSDQMKAKILEIDEFISTAFKAKFNNRSRKQNEQLRYPTSTIKIAIVDSNKQSVHLFLQGDGNEFVVNPKDQTYTWTALRDPKSQDIQLPNGQACPGQSGPSDPISKEPQERVRVLDYKLVTGAKYLVIGSDGIGHEELKQQNPDQILGIPHRGRLDDASTVIIKFETSAKRKMSELISDPINNHKIQRCSMSQSLTIQELQQNTLDWFKFIVIKLSKGNSIDEAKLDKIKNHFSLFIEGPKRVISMLSSRKYTCVINHIKDIKSLSLQDISKLCSTIIEIIIECYVVEMSDIETRLKESNDDHQVGSDFFHFIQGLDSFLTFIDTHFYKKHDDNKKPRILQETASISTLRNLVKFRQNVRKNEFVNKDINQETSERIWNMLFENSVLDEYGTVISNFNNEIVCSALNGEETHVLESVNLILNQFHQKKAAPIKLLQDLIKVGIKSPISFLAYSRGQEVELLVNQQLDLLKFELLDIVQELYNPQKQAPNSKGS